MENKLIQHHAIKNTLFLCNRIKLQHIAFGVSNI
jgi:hypothetical protein